MEEGVLFSLVYTILYYAGFNTFRVSKYVSWTPRCRDTGFCVVKTMQTKTARGSIFPFLHDTMKILTHVTLSLTCKTDL